MIKIPVYFSGYRRRKDRSASLNFVTQEIDSSEIKLIDELVGVETFGWLMFKPNEDFTPDELPSDEPSDEQKSPSQRLRARMYVYHKGTSQSENWDTWYKGQMEKMGQKYLDQLEE